MSGTPASNLPGFGSGRLSGLKFRKQTVPQDEGGETSHTPPSRGPTFRSGNLSDLSRRKTILGQNKHDGSGPYRPPYALGAGMVDVSPSIASNADHAAPLLNPTEQLFSRPLALSQSISSLQHVSASNPDAHEPTSNDDGRCSPRIECVLRRNRFGPTPLVCGPWEARVACRGGLSGFVLTSPSHDYVPKMPKDADVIQTYVDGRWGVNEYSRHPQWFVSETMAHIACIPSRASPPEIPDILFQTLDGTAHWEEDPSVVVHGLGLMIEAVRQDLADAAATAIRRTESISDMSDTHRCHLQFLCMLLRQAVDRMNYLPSVATRAVAIAAHVQRLSLELAGLYTYLTVVVERLQSPRDFSGSILDVVGVFLKGGEMTQTWHRVGVPYWVLQPFKDSLAVWRVEEASLLPSELSSQLCDPPILHPSGAFLGVSSLTGNWVSSMLVSVSKHITGSHLSPLTFTSASPYLPVGSESSRKRPRIEERPIVSSHLAMREAVARRSKIAPSQAPRKEAAASQTEHPSRSHVLSPFVDIPQVWHEALRSVGPLPQTPDSALYFFPPPFLLDTVPHIDSIPPGCIHPDRIRTDAKVWRYLHNLIRIRDFCRARLFDISLENRPLTVREWRAALWGDYSLQTSVLAGTQTSDARRAKRRTGERNEMVKLFHHIAHMDSYNEDLVVEFEGAKVGLVNIMNNPAIRTSLLWESHEVNFRAELLALDSLLVPSHNWKEMDRWEREMKVSGVWGAPSSAATVAASTDRASRLFCWHSPSHDQWETCRERLRTFAQILTRWPGCPELVLQGGNVELEVENYQDVQQAAVKFYIQTFISRYSRLPIPPIASL